MDVFGSDALIGDYRLSDHGLILSTFNYTDSYDLGISSATQEVYLGKNPKPVYLGSKPNGKLELTMTVMHNECLTNRLSFTINECREIVGRLTGFQGYKKLYINKPRFLENLYYNVKVNSIEYEKSGDNIIGIRFNMECDSPFAWVEDEIMFETENDLETIIINNNSDLFYDYNYPTIIIESESDIEGFEIINNTDNGRTTMIDKICAGEVITINSQLGKITSSLNTNFSETFNYKFPQLVRGDNEIVVSHPVTITCQLVLPRKIGVL